MPLMIILFSSRYGSGLKPDPRTVIRYVLWSGSATRGVTAVTLSSGGISRMAGRIAALPRGVEVKRNTYGPRESPGGTMNLTESAARPTKTTDVGGTSLQSGFAAGQN